MRQSVLAAWHRFSEPLEGRVPHMYLDVKGLVTTGVGNLIDPLEYALRLPWKRPDGAGGASDSEVRAEWLLLKSRQDLKSRHYKFAGEICKLRLTDADIDAIVLAKLLENERFMQKRYFRDFDEFPADGQLGILSMAWAVGSGFPGIFKNFTRAVLDGDWIAAKACCKIRTTGNPGVVPRNRANELCFENAADVLAHGADPEVLHWPNRFALPAIPEPPPQGLTDEDRRHAEALRAETIRQSYEDNRVAVTADRDADVRKMQ